MSYKASQYLVAQEEVALISAEIECDLIIVMWRQRKNFWCFDTAQKQF